MESDQPRRVVVRRGVAVDLEDYDFRVEASTDDAPPESMPTSAGELDASQVADDSVPDVRLYVPDPASWTAHVKYDSEKIYCYQRNPGENYFHLILSGEIYLVCGNEKLCLRCALRRGVVTLDRLHWQHRVKRQHTAPL
ncbi:MAG: hypothetical protein B7Z55_04135 [Planctomycetales bacterium 12-60-4]|nr:MAG: hypothetical protein B7Z55_04135 [Planctomycetales bacterium 12-60-4]